jgi:uncharacterized protein YndB with AHSA1/START domain
MNRPSLVCTLVLLLAPPALLAHGPSRQMVVREIQISAPAAKVWNLVADFCAIAAWNPETPLCEAEPGNKPDTIRTVTLSGGERIREKLVKHQPENRMMQYMLVEPNEKALPVNTLGSTLTVREADGGNAVVEWKAAFYRSFPGPTPPPELSDEAATAAVTKIVDAGPAGIKALAEK